MNQIYNFQTKINIKKMLDEMLLGEYLNTVTILKYGDTILNYILFWSDDGYESIRLWCGTLKNSTNEDSTEIIDYRINSQIHIHDNRPFTIYQLIYETFQNNCIVEWDLNGEVKFVSAPIDIINFVLPTAACPRIEKLHLICKLGHSYLIDIDSDVNLIDSDTAYSECEFKF